MDYKVVCREDESVPQFSVLVTAKDSGSDDLARVLVETLKRYPCYCPSYPAGCIRAISE